MAMDQCIRDMCLLVYPRHLRGLVMFLALTLAFPANAQTNSDPPTKITGTVSAQARSMPGLTSPNPATAKAASNPITLSTKPAPTSDASKGAGALQRLTPAEWPRPAQIKCNMHGRAHRPVPVTTKRARDHVALCFADREKSRDHFGARCVIDATRVVRWDHVLAKWTT
jgi:hypothetical protein